MISLYGLKPSRVAYLRSSQVFIMLFALWNTATFVLALFTYVVCIFKICLSPFRWTVSSLQHVALTSVHRNTSDSGERGWGLLQLDGYLLQIHLLQAVALLLEKWINSADPVNQSLFCHAVIDFDEFFDIIRRNALSNQLTHQTRTWLVNTFNTIKAKREHLRWTWKTCYHSFGQMNHSNRTFRLRPIVNKLTSKYYNSTI